MAADHGAAAVVPLQSRQLRKQAGRKQAGISPDAVMGLAQRSRRLEHKVLWELAHKGTIMRWAVCGECRG